MKRSVELGFVVLAACGGGGKATLDHADTQAKVAAEAEKRVGVPVAAATCPSKVTPASGSSFTCNVTFKGGGALTFKVDQVDAAGSLSIAPIGDWLLGDKMEQDLVTEMYLIGHKDAVVDCGTAVMPITLPVQVKCKVKKADATEGSVVVALDAQRNVDWKLDAL